MGMICVDTVPEAGLIRSSTSIGGANRRSSIGIRSMSTVGRFARLTDEDETFAMQLADQICRSIRADQDALAARMAAVVAADLAELEAVAAIPAVDPESYADMEGGQKMLKAAFAVLERITEADLKTFRNLDPVDEATRAVLKAVLVSAGEVSDGEWGEMKVRVDQAMIKRLMAMDPQVSGTCRFGFIFCFLSGA